MVCAPVGFYESQNALPVHWGQFYVGTVNNFGFFDQTNTLIPNTQVEENTLPGKSSETYPLSDLFVIEVYHEPIHDYTMVVIYGYTGDGTFAGALYFKNVYWPSLGNTIPSSDTYVIIRWTDTNGNGLPDSTDSYLPA